jgi:aspartyl-tRNA(Asn)/glutamyl-tRNA(Gln) amidotransferase subunit A
VNRLLESGCILLGKTNLHEFAYGATNVNPHYGPVRNPWNRERISGGSSGGSAASVVSAQAVASIGTDTGGSIRIPSAACGCVGFKPTYGRVSLEGIIPLSGSLDHAGPLTRSVMDAAFVFDVIAESSPWKSANGAAQEIRQGIKSFQIGIPRQYFFDRVQPDVRRAVMAAIRIFEHLGAGITELNLKGMEETERMAAEITGCEALAFHEQWLSRKSRDYGEDVRKRLEQSRTVTATAYIQMMQMMQKYGRELDAALGKVNLILAPALPIEAPGIDEKVVKIGRSREDARRALLRLTRPANLAGVPAISVPCGFTAQKLPVGLQIIGRRFDDASVLRAAHAYESATSWHHNFPQE